MINRLKLNIYMYSYIRHEYRNRVKKSFNNKKYFFICWKVCRVRDILTSASCYMSSDLNGCGWTFKRSDNYYYNLYKKYQEKEELIRLFAWVTDHIADCDKNSKKLDYEYILEIMTDAVNLLKNIPFCNSMQKDMAISYLNALQELK